MNTDDCNLEFLANLGRNKRFVMCGEFARELKIPVGIIDKLVSDIIDKVSYLE